MFQVDIDRVGSLGYAEFTCRGIGITVVVFISLAAMEAVGFTQKEA